MADSWNAVVPLAQAFSTVMTGMPGQSHLVQRSLRDAGAPNTVPR